MFTMDASLCGTTLLPKHGVNLFGHAAVKTQLSSRPEDLLGVRVAVNDGLPQHICERCKRRVETLERAVADLERFSSQARESYEIVQSKLFCQTPLATIRIRLCPHKHTEHSPSARVQVS